MKIWRKTTEVSNFVIILDAKQRLKSTPHPSIISIPEGVCVCESVCLCVISPPSLGTPKPALLTSLTLHYLSVVFRFDSSGCPRCSLYARHRGLSSLVIPFLPTTMTAPFSSRRLPANAAGYELREQIGQGTCAAVYRAWCEEIKDEVAIKVVDLEWLQAPLEDIGREIQVMSLSSHPNVVPFSTAFVQAADLWIVMPLLTGGSVLSLMNCAFRDGLPEEYALYVLWCVLNALEYFHGNGQMHRDVKAANLMFDSQGNTMLSDYGMMGWMVEGGWDRKQRQTFVGTPCWMAPEVMEQAEGYDYKADIWSLGITAIELAQGRAPYTNYPPMKVLFLTLQNPPPTLIGEAAERYSTKYKDFIRVCLQKDPKARPSAKQLLKHSLFSGGVSKPPTLADTIAKLPPIGSRGGSQKQLFRQLQKVSAPQRSGIYDMSAKGLGWDFGDDSDFQKTAESLADELSQNKTPQHSPPDSSAASLTSDSSAQMHNDISSVPEPQNARNTSHTSFDSVQQRAPAGATSALTLISSAVKSLGGSRVSNVPASASVPAMKQPSSVPVLGDNNDSLRPGSSQGGAAGMNSVPAKTVGLLRKGRFTISDVTTPDKLDSKLDSFLDFGPLSEQVQNNGLASDAHFSTSSMPAAIPPQNTAPCTSQDERLLDVSQKSSQQQAAANISTSNGMRIEDARDIPSVSAPSLMHSSPEWNPSTSGGQQPTNSDIKPPAVRVVNVPNAAPVAQPHAKSNAMPESSFATGVAPVTINLEPQHTGQPEVAWSQNAQVPPSIPIHQVPSPPSIGADNLHMAHQNDGRPTGTQVTTASVDRTTSDRALAPATSSLPVTNSTSFSTVPPSISRPPANIPAPHAAGMAAIPSSGVSVTTIPSKPVKSPPSQQKPPASQKPVVPVVIPSSTSTGSVVTSASLTGNGSGVQSASSGSSVGILKKKSRFEVKDVPMPSGKPIIGSSLTISSVTDSVSAALPPSVPSTNTIDNVITSAGTSAGTSTNASLTPVAPKPKSRFEVKDVEPRQPSTTNGAPLNTSSAPSSANNSAPGSRQGTPISSPHSETVPGTFAASAKSALFLLTELQGTIQCLLYENESLKREVAILRGQTQTGPVHGSMVGHRSVSAGEVSASSSLLVGATSGQHVHYSQSANPILMHAPVANQHSYQVGQTTQYQSNAQPLYAPVSHAQAPIQPQPTQGHMQSYSLHVNSQQIRSDQNPYPMAHFHSESSGHYQASRGNEVQNPHYVHYDRAFPFEFQHQQQANQSHDQMYAHLPFRDSGPKSAIPTSSNGIDASAQPPMPYNYSAALAHGFQPRTDTISTPATSISYAQYGMQALGTDNSKGLESNSGNVPSSNQEYWARNESRTGLSHSQNVMIHGVSHASTQSHSMGTQAECKNVQTHSSQSRVIDVQLPSVQQPGGIAASLAAVMTTVDGPRGVMTQTTVEQSRHTSSAVSDAPFRNVQ